MSSSSPSRRCASWTVRSLLALLHGRSTQVAHPTPSSQQPLTAWYFGCSQHRHAQQPEPRRLQGWAGPNFGAEPWRLAPSAALLVPSPVNIPNNVAVQIHQFAPVFASFYDGSIPLSRYLQARLTWKWRYKLTDHVHSLYFRNKAYYFIGEGGVSAQKTIESIKQ